MSFRQWFFDNFDECQIREIAMYGTQGGFPGITYTTHIVNLFNEYLDSIDDILSDVCLEVNYRSDIMTLHGFIERCVWAACEILASEFVNGD